MFQRSTGSNLPSSSLPTVATAGILDASAYSWGNSMVSVLSKAEYNYDSRYFISGSFRRDGSSRLSEDARWGNFWSVAGSWKINNEEFLKDVDWVSNLRIRASYGINGTLPSNNYGWRSLASFGSPYNQNPGAILSTVADANLSWETSYNTNVAVEAGFWDQRLYTTIEYFNRDSKDLLQDVPISTVTGFSSTLKNVGEVNNHGVEIELGGDIIRKKDLTWSASLTASTAKSTVTKLYGGQDIIWSDPTGGDGRCTFVYREGESMLAIYGREWAGVNSENGFQMWYVNGTAEEEQKLLDDGTAYEYKGRVVVEDADGETYANRKIIGSLVPKLQGGINTNLSYKGLDVSLNFIYKFGKILHFVFT
jgi:outer membrane receptor protein involved in Fe transport